MRAILAGTLFLLVVSLAASSTDAADPIDLSVEIAPVTARISDPITLTITATGPEGVTITFPQETATLGAFDVMDVRDDMDIPIGAERKSVRRYKLECIRSGKQTIPSLDVAYVDRRGETQSSGVVSTKPQSITITSSLDEPIAATEFRDIKPVVFLEEKTLKQSSVPIWVWVITGCVLAAVLAMVYFLTRAPRPVPPAQWALGAIDELNRRSSGTSDGSYIHQKLSDIVREFVDRQFSIAAPRLTTSEFLLALESNSRLPDSLQQQMRNFMQSADMIKFAAASAGRESVEQSIDQAKKFVVESERIASLEAESESEQEEPRHGNSATDSVEAS